jgi:hypothetical protein
MGRKFNKIVIVLFLLTIVGIANSCVIKYSFTGASIPPAAKTFSVLYFPNNAAMVAPTLSNVLTEGIKDRFTRQTRLTQIPEEGDFALEGEITRYETTPTSVSADEYALQNRLTITVQVRFNNAVEPQWNFNKSFSAFADYDANQLLQEVEGALIEEIVETLVDNIFNATASNW